MSKPEQHPGGYTLRPVLEGDTYARAVEGGVRRSPVPADGLLVVMEDREVFIARWDVQYALDLLAAKAGDTTIAKRRWGRRGGGKR